MTKAKEALDISRVTDGGILGAFDDSFEYKIEPWFLETIRKALELLDKVERAGEDMQQIDGLQTLSDDEWDFINTNYILIERDS
jgi:hypothetical protein